MKSILIRKEMVNAINEEKGISDSLATNVRNIYEELVKNIAQNKNNIETQMNGVKYKNGTYKRMDFFGKQLTINYVCYNFINYQCFDFYLKAIPYVCHLSGNNVMDITIYAVSGKILWKTLLNDLTHELTHAFQQNKSKRVFASSKVYRIATQLKDDKSRTKLDNCIGRTIYLSYKFEQDAYFHSLYITLMHCEGLASFDITLKNSDIYKVWETLMDNMEFIKSTNYVPEELQKVGYNYRKLITNCDKAIKNIEWKISRVVNKAKKDFKKAYVVEEKESFGDICRFDKI